jgi:hypothetical protein
VIEVCAPALAAKRYSTKQKWIKAREIRLTLAYCNRFRDSRSDISRSDFTKAFDAGFAQSFIP